jgi:hypothetical protein
MDPLRLEMLQMMSGYWVSKMLYCAARLNVADHLAAGPKTTSVLAAALHCHEDSLHRLLRALASIGVFREVAPRTFALTPKAEYLRTDTPLTLRDAAVMLNDELFEVWCDILHSVETGQGAVQKRFGGDFFAAVLAKDPQKSATFDRAMEQIHGPELELMLGFFDWKRFGRIADIGGGSGQSLFAILAQFPALKGTLFDLPGVIDRVIARAKQSAHPAARRCDFVGGSFFDKVPPGADCYYLRHIVHDWNDADSVRILRACRDAMPAHASLVVVEKAIPAGNDPEFAKLLDINMLAIGGKERTLPQYQELFAQAGLRLHAHHVTPGPIDLIETKKAS